MVAPVTPSTRRNLRDIADGHLSIWVTAAFFDTATGRPLNPPTLIDVRADRAPAAGTPNAGGDWWTPLVRAGYLRLPPEGTHPQKYLITPAGLAAIEGGSRG